MFEQASIGKNQKSIYSQMVFLIAGMLFVGLASCSQDSQKIALKRQQISGQNATKSSLCPVPSNTTPASSAALALVTAKCSTCHAAGAKAPDLSTPESIIAAQSAILQSTSAGAMPPSGKLGAAELEILQKWVSEANPPAAALVEAIPTYNGTIKAIIDQKCAWCHSSTANAGVRTTPYLSTFAQVGARSAEILDQMNDGKMPPRDEMPRLAAGDLNAFQLWVSNAKLEGTVTPLIAANVQPGYMTSVNNFFSGQCTGCHSTAGGQLPDLNSLATAKSSAASSYAAITEGRMPPGQTVTPANLLVLKKWIDGNFPLNDGDPAIPSVSLPPIAPLPAGCDTRL